MGRFYPILLRYALLHSVVLHLQVCHVEPKDKDHSLDLAMLPSFRIRGQPDHRGPEGCEADKHTKVPLARAGHQLLPGLNLDNYLGRVHNIRAEPVEIQSCC